VRATIKQQLARLERGDPAPGLTALVYHRVGGGSTDERDVSTADFEAQMRALRSYSVQPLDQAVVKLRAGDASPSVVLTFDDGFLDVHTNAWPVLRDAGLPFTIYVATGYVGGTMHWEGSTAKDTGAPALTWDQLGQMVDSGLCTLGNHTHNHVRPEMLDDAQLERCSAEMQQRLGVRPEHFAYTWGVPVPRMETTLRGHFTSAATGEIGRSLPGQDLMRLKRIPVRGSDPLPFFEAKLRGRLLPERSYSSLVAFAKRAGVSA
jgi:peptidoglycan/xylan/chitin deacetylase (PgdA/CDA1 family)